MNIEELLGRYAAGERDFSGVKMDSPRLRDAELPGINLSGAILFGAKLNRANLSGANLSYANLGSAWLEEANLTGANLSHAVVSDGVLAEADLSDTDLSYADLTACPLIGANLSRANLTGTLIGNEPLLKGANLTDVDLSQSKIDLPGGIENPRIEGAIFCNTTLPDGTKIINFF
ncbi:pentapeptide repeat-containing protein [Nostoc sp.]|uniref:pentapeptide repeat-containing protein n=1 Tax=Nostoc sp. TaxID=1180 RepID=UPI002FF8CA3B